MDVSALLAALDALVLERIDGATFVPRGAVPEWCLRLPVRALHDKHPITLDGMFPFLAAYLPDAEQAWRAGVPERASSGFWTETASDGEELHLEAFPICVDGAEVIVVMRNERLYRQQQLVLQRARELHLAHAELGREIEQKDVLLHTVVHELASPLERLLGMLSLLSELQLGEREGAWLAAAVEAAARQKQLVSEVLEVFSAEHEALPPPADAAPDLHAALKRVLSELEPIARRKRVRLVMQAGDMPCRVAAEERRLVRVLANLITNALRNSPADAAVTATVRHAGGAVEVLVEDDGPPVPLALLPRLFEKLAAAGERDLGIGLGLYFCRITVERWGGGTGYEPRSPHGVRFWIRLRCADSGAGTSGPA